MKKNLNEEINKMRSIMGLEEQNIWDKIKNTAQNVGSKIQTGVNQVAQTIADKTKPQQSTQTPTQNTSSALKEYNDFVNKWKSVNDNPNSTLVFIEGNDNGFNDTLAFEMMMKTDAINILTQRYMKQHPEIKTMSKKIYQNGEPEKCCYLKTNEKGNTVTYCAFVFDLKMV